MNRAGVPKSHQTFRKRWRLCRDMRDRYGDQLPHGWVTGDDEFRKPAEFRRELHDRGEPYLLAVPRDTTIRDLDVPPATPAERGPRPQRPQRPSQRVDVWTAARSDDEWTRVDVRDGEQGPLLVEAIQRRVETGQFRATKVTEEILVVIRYRVRDEQIVMTDSYLSHAESPTSLETFCRVAKAEHRIEECLQRVKSEAGLADFSVPIMRRSFGPFRHQRSFAIGMPSMRKSATGWAGIIIKHSA